MVDEIERESTDATGGYTPSVSADGRYVEFHAFSSQTVYVKDRQTGTLTLLPQGGTATNGYSFGNSASGGNAGPTVASISADGTKVVFNSEASNGGDFRNSAVFVYDLRDGSVTMASNTTGLGTSEDTAYQDTLGPTISADGSVVEFESASTDVTASSPSTRSYQVYVRLANGTIVLASSDANGVAGSASSTDGTLSQNGGFVAFETSSTNFDHAQTSGNSVYVKDLTTGSLTLASPDESYTSNPSISADGTKVVFEGSANGTYQQGLWLRDITKGTTTLVSTDVNGTASNGYNINPILSADGKDLFFQSNATNLASGVDGSHLQNYVKDLTTGVVTLVFDNTGANTYSNPLSKGQIFSGDDSVTVFATDTAGLTADDTNANLDAFAFIRTPPVAPTITGTHPTAVAGEAQVTPFSGVTIADGNDRATDSVLIVLSGGGGTLKGDGLVANADGSYGLAAASPATITAELDGLSFTPAAGTPGGANPTTFTLTDMSSAGLTATDNATVVTDTAAPGPTPTPTPPPVPQPSPTPTPAPQPTPTPTPSASDTLSIDAAALYDGASGFVLTGSASSASGIGEVRFSALVGGTRQDLGAATVNADGLFSFTDAIGRSPQSFIQATLTDGAGAQTTADASLAFSPGSAKGGSVARQQFYSADGDTLIGTSTYKADGSRQVDVAAGDATFHSEFFDTFENHGAPGTTFVFDPGFGLDTIRLFRADGSDHDTIDLPSSDFASVADVLRHTTMNHGTAVIHDATSGDTIRLTGVTKDELRHNPGDFAFHG